MLVRNGCIFLNTFLPKLSLTIKASICPSARAVVAISKRGKGVNHHDEVSFNGRVCGFGFKELSNDVQLPHFLVFKSHLSYGDQ